MIAFAPDGENPYLELCFRPTIASISGARRFVLNLYGQILSDPDEASRIALATHELLENALKYSLDGRTFMRIEVSHAKRPLRACVETRNRISPERKAALDEVFDEMARANDAASYYGFAMERTRHRRSGSGLGFARIWSEGEMELTRSYSEGEVRIVAVAALKEIA